MSQYSEDPVSPPFFENGRGDYCASYNEVAELTREEALAACVAGVELLATPEELLAIAQRFTTKR